MSVNEDEILAQYQQLDDLDSDYEDLEVLDSSVSVQGNAVDLWSLFDENQLADLNENNVGQYHQPGLDENEVDRPADLDGDNNVDEYQHFGIGENVDEENEPALFDIQVKFFVKDFVSQRGGKLVLTMNVACSEVDEFKAKVWPTVHRHLKNEAKYNDETNKYEWAANPPVISNIEYFTMFQPCNSKRTYTADRLTTTILQNWSSLDDISCFIYVHGRLIHSKMAYADILKNLIQPNDADRAGAAPSEQLFAVINRLKAHHSNMRAHDMAWYRWANEIVKSSRNEDEMIQDLPPTELIHLFSQPRTPAQQEFQSLRRGVCIGNRINNGLEGSVKRALDEMSEVVLEAEQFLQKSKRVKRLLEACYEQIEANENLLLGFNAAVGPEEDEFGTALLNQMDADNDMDDNDHRDG